MTEPGWRRSFAWLPVRACGRWRWLVWVERHALGRVRAVTHDWPDSSLGHPWHMVEHTCRHCGARYTI